MKSSNSKSATAIIAAIRALDLGPIKIKLMDADEGHGWSRQHADRVEIGYKQFLTLLVTHPEATIAPNKEIDKFWHAHILDTMKYADDCEQVFGYFLHHFPYFGMRSAEDAAQLEQASRETRRLFAEEFGATMPGASAHCMAAVTESASAHCMAAVSEAGSAHCMAAVTEAASAHCMAAVSEAGSAHCMAAVTESASAHCMAAITESASAHCMATKPMTSAAYGAAANADKMARPTLALAA
jgi:hypothetical protein